MPGMREDAPGATRRRLPKDERRARILDAAARVFADRGYEAASLDEIAEAAEISKPVIYDHFDSKKALHIELLELQAGEMLEFMTRRAISQDTTEGQLAAGLEAFLEFVETHPYAWRMIFRDPTAADAEIEQAQRRVQLRATSAIAAIAGSHPMEDLPQDELDHELSVEAFSQMLKTAANGIAAWWYEHRDISRETIVKMLMDFVWLGLERVQDGERWGRE
jgi:AcrR family transcriptional regulator